MKINQNKSKISTIAIILVLTISAIIVALPAATAQDAGRKTTYPIIGAMPNPVGVNQQVLLHVGITDRLANVGLGWEGLTVTVTKPDGTTETLGPFRTDPTGGTGAAYTPSMVGTYKFQTHFPEQLIPAYVGPFLGPELLEGTVMEASNSEILELVVQNEPIDFYPGSPLPAEYWNRPIDAQLREWSMIAGNWLAAYNNVPPNLIVPYNEGPETSHILWAKQLQMGGLAGGATGNHAFECGDAYEGFFLGAVILGGNLYYNNYKSGFPTQEVVAVNLHTGEELWRKPLLDPDGISRRLSFGQVFYWDSYNYHAAFPYLWATSGSTWHAFDPFEGHWVYSMENVPSGTNIYGPNGEIFRYTVDLNDGWMTLWNSSRVVSNEGSWGSAVMRRTFNATNGIEWNATISDSLPGGVKAVLEDRIIGGEFSPTEVNSWALSLEAGKEGTILFQNTWQAPTEWASGKVYIDWAAVSAEDNVFVLWARESREYYAFSTETGAYLWGPTVPEYYLNIYKVTLEKYGQSKIAYGKLFSTAMSGIVYCYDVTTGNLEWTYEADDPYNEILWSNNWPLISLFITDGKIYIGHEEHSPIDPKPRGAPFICLDVENGDEIFRVNGLIRENHWGGRALIGDSIIATLDSYDQRIYAIGKGPSALTVEAPLAGVRAGETITITGTITDVSPGSKDTIISARFPNGVPAVSDASMNDWMLYVYKQFPQPMATGVQVKLEAVDPNGNYQTYGTTTSDSTGIYGFSFEPEVPGQYYLMVTFEGTDSYYGSFATAYVNANPAPAPAQQIEPEPTQQYQAPTLTETELTAEMSLITTEVAILAAVAVACVIGVAAFWALRKRK